MNYYQMQLLPKLSVALLLTTEMLIQDDNGNIDIDNQSTTEQQ